MPALEPLAESGIHYSEPEHDLLERVAAGLPLAADLSRADITLWVGQGEAALVVAQGQPRSIASIYREPWTGRRLSLQENPLLMAGLQAGRRGRRQHNLLEQGIPVVQQVLPVSSTDDRVLAVMQIETSLIAWERHKRRHVSFRKAVQWLQQMVLRGHVPGVHQVSRFSEWDGVLFVDGAYNICYLSGIANNLYRGLGYLDELTGRHIGDLQTRDEALVRQAFAALSCQEHQVQEGSRNWTRSVVPIWSYSPGWWPLGRGTKERPVLQGAVVMVRDNTEALRKAQELKVLATMIQEVHHRVKNNLQTVASILRMQARRAQSEEAQLQLREAVNRVLAVAVIHEFLSIDEEQSINIREVCQRIVTQTRQAVTEPDKAIHLAVEGPVIYLPSQQATACALVANELLLNALEHAFDGRSAGQILLQLQDQGDQVVLQVADDGAGLPAGFEAGLVDSLGLSIVRILVEGDLKGEFRLEPAEPGTRAVVTFKKGR